MADSIVKLRVDSKEYDAKIKTARQGLLAMEKACRSVGGTLSVVEKSEMDFVKALGQMETVSNSSRTKMRELTEAIADMTGMYRRMTAEERSSDFGKAMADSINQLKSRAGDLKDQMVDLEQEINHLASDTSFTDGINMMSHTIGSCASAMVAWSGDGKEMERVIKDLAKIQTTINAVEALTKAFQKQNMVLLKNPYVAAAAAIAAMGVALYEYTTAESKAAEQVKLTDEEINHQVESLIRLKQYSEQASSALGKLTKSQAEAQYQSALGDLSGAQSARRQLESLRANVQSAYNQARRKYDASGTQVGSGTTGAYFTVYDQNAKADMERYEQQLKDIDQELQQLIERQKEFDRAVSEANARRARAGEDTAKSGSGSDKTKLTSGLEYKGFNQADAGSLDYLKEKLQYFQQMADSTKNIAVRQQARSIVADLQSQIDNYDDLVANLKLQPMVNTLKEDLAGIELEPLEIEVVPGMMKDWDAIAQQTLDAEENSKGTAAAWDAASRAMSSAGSALQNMEDPAAKVAGIILQAVASVASGFAQALASPATTAAGVFGWIAAATAGVATMAATIASIKSATSMAEGGLIKSASFTGDATPIMANAGEIVLNAGQQQNVASAIQSNQSESSAQPYVNSEMIYLGLNNWGKRTGRGELVFSR